MMQYFWNQSILKYFKHGILHFHLITIIIFLYCIVIEMFSKCKKFMANFELLQFDGFTLFAHIAMHSLIKKAVMLITLYCFIETCNYTLFDWCCRPFWCPGCAPGLQLHATTDRRLPARPLQHAGWVSHHWWQILIHLECTFTLKNKITCMMLQNVT